MPRDAIPQAGHSPAGSVVTPLAAVAANNAYFPNHDGKTIFFADNTAGGGSITVTFITGGTRGGLAIADQAVVVGAGVKKRCGPYPSEDYNQADGTTLNVDVSGNISIWAEG